MKKGLFLLCLLIASVTISAQQLSVDLMAPVKANSTGGESSVIIGDKLLAYDFTANTTYTKVKYFIRLYRTDNMEIIKEIRIDNDSIHKLPCAAFLKKINEKIYFIYERYNKYEYAGDIMAVEINTETLAMGAPRVLAHLAGSGNDMDYNYRYKQKFTLYLKPSPDNTKWLLFFRDNRKKSFYYALLDHNLGIVHEQNINPSEQDEGLVYFDALINNQGTLYTGYRIYPGKNSNPERNGGYLCIKKIDREPEFRKIDLGTAKLSMLKIFTERDNAEIRMGGLYTENDIALHRGAFYTVLDSLGTFLPAQKTPFPDSLVEQLRDEGWAMTKDKKYGISEEIIFEGFRYENGDIALTGVFREMKTTLNNHGYMVSGSFLNINLSDNKATFYRVPRMRVSMGLISGDSYRAFVFHNNLIVFYNDDLKNIKQDMSSYPTRSDFYDDVALTAVIIKPGISITREPIVDLAKENYLGLPENMITDSIGRIWTPFYKIKGFGRVSDNFRWAKILIQ